MTPTNVRRVALRVFLAFLVLTAMVAIVSLISGEFGELEVKILVTSLTISATSICAMSCAAFVEKRRGLVLGGGGIVLAVVTAVLVIVGLWSEIESEPYWKSTFSVGVSTVAFAHGFLLLLPDLDRRHRWVRIVTTASIAVLAAMIVFAAWGEIENERYFRALAVVAVLVGLETLAVPILMRLRRGDVEAATSLVLEPLDDGTYRDRAGSRYRVSPIDRPGPGGDGT